MKVGGGLYYVEGPMGAGKSLYGVRRIRETLWSGGHVVTNLELRDTAFAHLALRVTRNGRRRGELEHKFRSLYHYEPDWTNVMSYRLGCHACGRNPAVCGHKPKESRGLFLWDEGHNDLNNRSWREEGRNVLLEWATQLRKLGFAGYLLTQHADNTDAALRRVCGYRVRLQNQREHTRVFGVRFTPIPLFLAAWYPTHLAIGRGAHPPQPVKPERYFLDWHRHLYDTHGLYHGLATVDPDEPDVRWLGLPEAAPKGLLPAGRRAFGLVGPKGSRQLPPGPVHPTAATASDAISD